MKKLFFLITLLSLCIISVGCGGSSNSSNGSAIKNLTVRVANNIINSQQQASDRASIALSDVKLFFNGVEFPGHSMLDGDYIFTKIMYEADALQMISNSKTSNIKISFNQQEIKIDFEKAKAIPENLMIKLNNNTGKVAVSNNGNDLTVIKVNDEEYVSLDEIVKVSIDKLGDLSAKVTFFNILDEGLLIDYDEWKITGYSSYTSESVNTPLKSWTRTLNNTDKKLNINSSGTVGNNWYEITLTNEGEASAKSYNLNNTFIKIDYIRKKDANDNLKDVVDTGILQNAIYRPTTVK